MSTDMSPDEVRRDMKARYDSVNAEAEERRERRRAGDVGKDAEESRRWQRPDDKPAHNEEDSDSSGS